MAGRTGTGGYPVVLALRQRAAAGPGERLAWGARPRTGGWELFEKLDDVLF